MSHGMKKAREARAGEVIFFLPSMSDWIPSLYHLQT